MEHIIWNDPQVNLSCGDTEVHIWLASAGKLKKYTPLFKTFLTHDESSQAMRFVFENDRDRYIISKVALRDILSLYLEINPEMISFVNNEYGKPSIDKKDNPRDITFNLSHAGDIIIIGITKNREIGIDVEKITEMESIDSLIQLYFSHIERKHFDLLSLEEKNSAFFTCWTRKEAYVKARGKGLSYPLESFSVTVAPGDSAALLHDDNNDILSWSLKDIPCPPEYAGAVAVRGRPVDYRYYRWEPPIIS